MCCDRCHETITPGSEKTVWDSVRGTLRVCAICCAFLVTALGNPSPPHAGPPIMLDFSQSAAFSGTNIAQPTHTTIQGFGT
jgi:hypothetical protein